MEYILLILLLIIAIQIQYLTLRISNNRPLTKHKPTFVDTSALMDGRIATAAATGFIGSRLIVPKSVLAELQYLADTADSDKRTRARRGLDVVAELKALGTTSVEIMDDGKLDEGGVDGRLVDLAKKYGGSICTIDFNLNKVARAENVFVQNINELAQSLRMAFLPGERVSIQISQKGQDAHQGVGYLADGTMVVVDQAASAVGKNVEIEFIRSLQTAAGRMLFAKLVKPERPAAGSKDTPTSSRTGQRSTQKTQTPKGRQAKRRPRSTKEDSLIELVNNQ